MDAESAKAIGLKLLEIAEKQDNSTRNISTGSVAALITIFLDIAVNLEKIRIVLEQNTIR